MKNLDELCEGILDTNADVSMNGFYQYISQYINPAKFDGDFFNLKWDDPKRYDIAQGIIAHLEQYPTIPSAEAKKRIKAGDPNIVGLIDEDSTLTGIKKIYDIFLFNPDKTVWTNYWAQQSKHIHLDLTIGDEKWRSSLSVVQIKCKTIDNRITKFYDCSI